MKKQRYLVFLFVYFLFFSCKVSNETLSKIKPVDGKPAEEQVENSESLESILTKKTTLIKKVVFYKETKLNKSVKEYNLEYISNKNLPMVLFVVKVDLNDKGIQIKPLTPNGSIGFGMQTIPDMVKSNLFDGYQTIAALNSDYFDMSTGEPRGITIVNGIPLKAKTTATRSYFGITKTGNPIIGNMKTFPNEQNMIMHAMGGFQRLVQEGKPVAQTDAAIHPRTAVAFNNNKEVFFLIVDGRSPDYSNGLTLDELAEIFHALGVREAVNLDGGGSTTYVALNQSNIAVKNRPSGGSLRKVANGWAIVSKTK
ncbi:NHL repeat containing protein [Pseudopedobacter saltans DSM 12145]|uniref:NHL repeat containing protein n=1 Tax=Pseudopedobacter saltans (strain ATCC 51119 / DSM 12145 / JCM 21818 / CCUG 39354 / LMG 10337 / NBRC 100064 / NCIMB 13643) TaxID=762903 RepID=F0SCS5_PSESL|nr:phosphodiester glycosidase family protein [Pseudopedobacter saltans]ADY50664.1 NHL repeat containing protein [Pseudopedobacter saltans DSM 12145]